MEDCRVLIVDDDPVVQFLHGQVILKSGITSEFLTFTNGKEALHYLNADHDGNFFYLILLDINMPVMNGWELLDELEKKRFPFPLKVVVVSSSVNTADREKASEYDLVCAYLAKPLKTADEIREILIRETGSDL